LPAQKAKAAAKDTDFGLKDQGQGRSKGQGHGQLTYEEEHIQ